MIALGEFRAIDGGSAAGVKLLGLVLQVSVLRLARAADFCCSETLTI